MTAPSAADVAVVGGGVMGLASAWRLARHGASVVVVDPAPGSGASGVAAGMLAPVTESRLGEEALLRLNLASWSRWPAFAAELDAEMAEAAEAGAAAAGSIGFRSDGTLMVAVDADDAALLRDLADRQAAMGLTVEPLRARDVRAFEPGLAPGVRSGLLAADERSVDPPALVAALLAAAERAGVRLVPRAVERIVTAPGGDRATGLQVAGGHRIEAGTVVLAAGSRSAGIAGLPDRVRPPVRPVKGQILTLRQPPGEPLVGRTVRGIVHGTSVYLVPRDDGRVVVGATSEERGWDTTPTAGGAYELLRDALTLIPGLDDAELVAVRSGLRPGSPDDLPMLGRSALDGLIVATGHHRNGILLTPVTADAVAALVGGGAVPDEVAACDPRRFAEVAA